MLFEAARWAPSSFNNQPWRILYARRESEHWPTFLGLLVESNRVWASDAAALLVFVSKTTFDHNGKPARTHSFDAGAAFGAPAGLASPFGLPFMFRSNCLESFLRFSAMSQCGGRVAPLGFKSNPVGRMNAHSVHLATAKSCKQRDEKKSFLLYCL